MVLIKCTKRLLKRVSDKLATVEPDRARILGDWFANMVPVWGGEIIVCLNERSLLTIVLPASAVATLGASLRERTLKLLQRLSVPASFIAAASREFEEVALVKTDGRSMLSHLRDVSGYCQRAVDLDRFERGCDKIEMYLTEWLFGPEPYRRPVELLGELVAAVNVVASKRHPGAPARRHTKG